MKYGMQVEVEGRDASGKPYKAWRDVHPTNGPPYRYDTKAEAESMARMCYGIEAKTRIVEVQ